ncbi:MAG: cereblon family protein [Proteobacteria bacterium]|nr:cereblon family protein [Pseudomonadota bacterium]
MDTNAQSVLWALKDRDRARTRDEQEQVDSEDSAGKTRRRILCGRCEFSITGEEERIEIAERHEHTCTNPHGFAYRIGCFAQAPGCIGIGRTETYWSWFPGYSWQLVLCRACQTHLGWLFRAASTGFYGLILDRLITESRAQ